MGTYNVPRSVKGEGRILLVFSMKGLAYTTVAGLVGAGFYYVFNLIGLTMIGIIITIIFALIGFIIGTFKIPEAGNFKVTKKVGGENIDDIIKRYIKFKRQKNKIYVYNDITKEETKDERK